MAVFEPTARTGAVIVAVEGKMYVWGGYTQIVQGEGDERFIVDIDLPDPDTEPMETDIEVLDIDRRQWQCYNTNGSVPLLGTGSVVCSVGRKLYLFGGYNEENFSADIFVLDTESLKWEERETQCGGPIVKHRAGMVVHRESLIVFGGVGKPFQHSEGSVGGATYLANNSFNFSRGYGWNNELHEYDTKTKCWRELKCTGSRPPPLGDFTFNKIDRCRALLFGGRVERTTFASVYILDLEPLVPHWTGPFEPHDQPWPVPRCLHASCCLVDPSSELASRHQKLITFWGKGSDNRHVEDIWVLNVTTMEWKKLALDLKARMWHMSCSYHRGGFVTDAIVFGGNKRRDSKFDRHVMTGLHILRFGVVEDLQSMCVRVVGKNWEQFQTLVSSQLPPRLQQMVQEYRRAPNELLYPTAEDFVHQ